MTSRVLGSGATSPEQLQVEGGSQDGPAEISTLEPPSTTQPSHPPPYTPLAGHTSPRSDTAQSHTTERTPLLSRTPNTTFNHRENENNSLRSARTSGSSRKRKPAPKPPKPRPWLIAFFYFLVTFLLFVSISTFILVGLSTLHPWVSRILPEHHGSTFLPMWYAALAGLALCLSLASFAFPGATPSLSAPLSAICAGILLVDIVSMLANPELRAKESFLTVFAATFFLVSAVVAALAYKAIDSHLPALEAAAEERREALERAREEQMSAPAEGTHYSAIPVAIARPPTPDSLASSTRPSRSKRFKRSCAACLHITGVTLPLLLIHIAILAALILMTADLILRAYDSSRVPQGRLIPVTPGDGAGTYRLHLACKPFGGPHRRGSEDGPGDPTNATLPRRTLLMFSPSGVAGLPGAEWALNISSPDGSDSRISASSRYHSHQRICYFDRPGYGFSDNAPTARLGHVAAALEQALEESGEVDRLTGRGGGRDAGGFVLVGQGYGGMVARVYAARNPELVSGMLFVDSQTEFTYFNPAERTWKKTLRYLFSDYASALLSPLGIRRYLALILGTHSAPPTGDEDRRGRLSRLLSPAKEGLNPSMARATLQEAHLAHSHFSSSYWDLTNSRDGYPQKAKTIVISSEGRLGEDDPSMERWSKGQSFLAHSLTRPSYLLRWERVEGRKHPCRNEKTAKVCESAVNDLLVS